MAEIINCIDFENEELDIIKYANSLGIDVFLINFDYCYIISMNNDDIRIGDKFNTNKFIGVSLDLSPEDRRLLIAYCLEIYEEFLNEHNENDRFVIMEKSTELDEYYYDLALDLLMPDRLFKTRLKTASRTEDYLCYLQQYFNVPKTAIEDKMKLIRRKC